MRNYRILIDYKTNKLKTGKWKEKYLRFYGNEIQNISEKTDEERKEFFLNDHVKFVKRGHPNDGMTAIIIKVKKPQNQEDIEKRFNEDRRNVKQSRRYYLFDLKFILNDEEKEENRLNLGQNEKTKKKRRISDVKREDLVTIPTKNIILTISKKEIESSIPETDYIKQKIIILLETLFENGKEFKPKYIDKTNKNYKDC